MGAILHITCYVTWTVPITLLFLRFATVSGVPEAFPRRGAAPLYVQCRSGASHRTHLVHPIRSASHDVLGRLRREWFTSRFPECWKRLDFSRKLWLASVRRRRSTGNCIADQATALKEARGIRLPIYVVFLDLHRGFDVLPHSSILREHHHSSVCGQTLSYLRLFFPNRSGLVRVFTFPSSQRWIKQDDPQGSVLSLILVALGELPRCFPRNFASTVVQTNL